MNIHEAFLENFITDCFYELECKADISIQCVSNFFKKINIFSTEPIDKYLQKTLGEK